MTVYFENTNGVQREIGTADTQEEAFKIIRKFLDEHSYKPPYWRSWSEENGEIWVDVGSHTEFFVIKGSENEIYLG